MGTFGILHWLILAGLFGGIGYLLFSRTRSGAPGATASLPSAALQLPPTEQMLLEQRVTNDGPSIGVAYLLWLFLGIVSGHRFYLGRPGSAVLQILSYVIIIGAVWWIVDGFSIPAMIRERRNALRENLAVQMLAARQAAQPVGAST